MARETKESKRIDAAVDAAYYRNGNGIQVNIFDLSKIMNAGRAAIISGGDVDAAIIAALKIYRKN